MADKSSKPEGTLTGAFPLPKGAIFAAVMLLGLELGVARQDWLWDWSGQTPSGVMAAVERQVIEPRPAPTVLVMGSSRTRDAVAPRVLEEAMHLPEGEVVNVALSHGTPTDALRMYTRHREKLSAAKVLVLGLEDWHVNAGFPPTDRQRRYATLEARWSDFAPTHRPSLIAGWLWRTYDARKPLRRWLLTPLKGRGRAVKLAEDGRMIWRDRRGETGPEEVDVSRMGKTAYGHWQHTRVQIEAIEALAEMARADDTRLVLFQSPWRDAYVDWVLAHHREAFEAYKATVAALPLDKILFERASALGMAEVDFYDYGHPAPRGARRISELLGERLSRAPGR